MTSEGRSTVKELDRGSSASGSSSSLTELLTVAEALLNSEITCFRVLKFAYGAVDCCLVMTRPTATGFSAAADRTKTSYCLKQPG